MMKRALMLDPADSVAVMTEAVSAGELVEIHQINGTGDPIPGTLIAVEAIARGHKIACKTISNTEQVIKYGASIGSACAVISKGSLVHTHNIKTNLQDSVEYHYQRIPKAPFAWDLPDPEVSIYRRANGQCGIRNELWIIPTVGCVNGIAQQIANQFSLLHDADEAIDGTFAFTHPYGCSQLGGDHERTRKLLQNMVKHPNAGGVLVLGLGCENNQVDQFKETLGEYDPNRVKFLICQQVVDETAAALLLLEELRRNCLADSRSSGRLSELSFGLECGGSDAFSGITANPLIGLFSDYITGKGGTTLLTEVPEMFGAEQQLMEQCKNRVVFDKTVSMINAFKQYYQDHDQPIYENPSPGNKRGGITTLEEKSLGCTKKAGNSAVVDVLEIDQRLVKRGLNLLSAPGNDIVATTALGTAGCQLVLFSTGRGTPLGGFIPTLKISTNSELAALKPHWIDFNAGILLDGEDSSIEVFKTFLQKITAVANGEKTAAELLGIRDIALFKTGVTL